MTWTLALVLASGVGGCSSSETPPCEAPPTPALLEAVPGQGRQLIVTWAAVDPSKLDHYALYWRQGSSPQALLVTVPSSDRGSVVARLDAGTYSFAVESVDSTGCASPRSPEVSATVPIAPQTAVPLGTDGAPSGYYEYLPPGYGDGLPRPLLVYLHGSYGLGNGSFDLDRLIIPAPGCCPPGMVSFGRWSATWPFVVLSPQSNLACEVASDVYPFIAWALAHYTVDPKRVYVTGMSCGSIRTWSYLAAHTDEQVAAVWILAGDPGTAWNEAGCNLGRVAIRADHGTSDTSVYIGPERALMQSLLGCPAPPRKEVIWTEVVDAGHEVAWESYEGDAGTEALNWLLTHSKP